VRYSTGNGAKNSLIFIELYIAGFWNVDHRMSARYYSSEYVHFNTTMVTPYRVNTIEQEGVS
jgi:hypothetical protein